MTTTIPLKTKLTTFFPALWGFAVRWVQTRNYRMLWRAIPALLIALAVSIGLLSQPFYDTDAKAKHYRLAAEQAIQAEKFEEAALYFNRLRQMDSMDDATLFRAALVRERAGDLAGAWEMIARIAEPEVAGYVPGHLWQAQQLGAGKSELPNEQAFALTRSHLQRALDKEPENAIALASLADLNRQSGNLTEAEKLLKRLAQLRPESRLMLVQLLDQASKDDQMKQEAARLVEYFEQAPESSLQPASYPNWAQALAVLDRFSDAIAVIEGGLKKWPEERGLRNALSRVYSTWAARLASDEKSNEKTNISERIQLLEKAVQLNPADPMPWGQIANLTRHQDTTAAKARALLNDLLAEGKAPFVVHLALGTIAAEQEDFERSKLHLEKAVSLNPSGAIALNNLAFLLADYGEPSDLKRAKELADQALELAPENLQFRDTRGKILMKMGSYRAAIEDFERILQANPDQETALRSLATAYQQLGDRDLADSFRARLKTPDTPK